MGKVHIGTMGWSYSFWIDNFYPKGTSADQLLTEYSKHFDTVEADSTFYRVPSTETLTKWKNQTPPDFLFSAKFPQAITHKRMLKNCEEDARRFVEKMSFLGEKLGVLLLQLPPAFGSKQIDLLANFVPKLPKGRRYAVEVRNKSLLDSKLYSVLREAGVALAIVDRPSMPLVEEITADFVYLRWEGDRKTVNGTLGKVETDRTADIKRWAEKMKILAEEATDVFGYFSKYYSGHPPTDVRYLLNFL